MNSKVEASHCSESPSKNINNTLKTPSEAVAEYSLTKAERLLTPKQYARVFSKATRYGNRNWTFIVRPNQEFKARLGMAIAKKQLAKAVWRNRIKRIAREAFRLHKKSLNGYDIVVLSRRGMQNVDNDTLHKSFLHLIHKINKNRTQ